jgi:protein SFI1
MERDADQFAENLATSRNRTFLYKWLDRTRAERAKHEEWEAQAIAFDRRILLSSSLFCWQRNKVETERFFARLTRRTIKARHLFLLTKAFTHWARIAGEEAQRTSTARRHILRTRYFNAWRDITTINELKVHRFVLARFLSKWRSRTSAVTEQSDLAVGLYQHNLVYRVYWQWFWKFLDNRAPNWHDTRLEKRTIKKWAALADTQRVREAWVVDQVNEKRLWNAFIKLKEKSAAVHSLKVQADHFRRASLLTSAFCAIRKSAQLAPLEKEFIATSKAALARRTLESWHHAAQLSRQSREIDRLRIVRNAFTAWNDRLRIKAIQDNIDVRVQVDCLYKWTIAARVSRFQRLHDYRLMATFFVNWRKRARTHEKSLDRAERRFASFKRKQTLRSALGAIVGATVQRREDEQRAISIDESKLAHRTFGRLLDKHAHLQQLDDWAERANYYVTTKNALYRWREATQYARRTRRREAYAQIRRTVKLNLVQRTFATWKDKLARFKAAQEQADRLAHDRLLMTAGAHFIRWHDGTAHYRDLESQAVEMYSSRLAASTLEMWTAKLRKMQAINAQAIALREESTHIVASTCLRKLSWRVFNEKRKQDNADAFRQRTFEKHVRRMIRYWWEQTANRLAERDAPMSPSERRGREHDDDNDGNDHAAHEKTQFQNPSRRLGDSTMLNEPGDETQQLEAFTPFSRISNLDLSFTVSPPRTTPRPAIPTSTSARRPATTRLFPPRPTAPRTEPRRRLQPSLRGSILRPSPAIPRVSPIVELPDSDGDALDTAVDLDPDGDLNNTTFWTSTPMPPRRPHTRPPVSAPPKVANKMQPAPTPAVSSQKPGYLKTPSKRSVVRERTRNLAGIGAEGSTPGVSSFQARLREGYRT